MRKFSRTKLKTFITKIYPAGVLLLITAFLFAGNYKPNTFLIGWDNLVPEFNFGANIQRSIFAVWQEYQGLGLLGGMGHASDLVHQIILLFLSFVLPLNTLRYFWVFLMLFLGGAGAYLLVKKVILDFSRIDSSKKQFISLLAGVFYTLNLSTVQTFYAPFEAFIGHFAALPWLLLVSLLFYKTPNRKNGLILALILFLAAPASYIPTLFVVYILSLIVILAFLMVFNHKLEAIKSAVKLFLIIVAVNAFWLFPFLYFTANNSSVALNAKINQMSTETIFLQNKAFGNVTDAMLLKGFWFNNVDPNLHGQFVYMFTPWRQYMTAFLPNLLGYFLFAVVIVGLIFSLKRKQPILVAFAALLLFSFTMLATNTPPFSWADILFRKIPLFNEAFRFPFTKFSILTSLVYSVFFAIGATDIIFWLLKFPILKKLNFYILAFIFLLLPIVFILPAFRGGLFYDRETIALPKQYTELFNYFNKQNPNTRIADLPQYTFWGWNYYNWGYGGSGFLWYGIKQPILDRAFDVWSQSDENYYWELSNALYSQNSVELEAVLNKYQINWLLVDKNVIDPSSSEAIFYPEIKSLISRVPSIQKAATFGNIDVYRVSLKDNPKSFVFTTGTLPSANGYQWGNFDKAYLDLGNYISTINNPARLASESIAGRQQSTIENFYPFRSLFSDKNQSDEEFKLTNGKNTITLSNPLPQGKNMVLNIPDFIQNEEIIPAGIITEVNPDNSLTLSLLVQTPEVSIVNGNNSKVIYYQDVKEPLIIIPANYPNTIKVNINGIENFSINYKDGPKNYGFGFLSLKQDNLIVASDTTGVLQTDTIKGSDIAASFGSGSKDISISNITGGSLLEVKIPKINDNYVSFEQTPSQKLASLVTNCDNFNKGPFSASLINKDNGKMLQLSSQNSTACISFYMPNLIHSLGYALFINNTNIQGRGLHAWLLNEDEKFSPIDTYLDQGKSETATFVIPPQEEYGRAYSLHLENISIGSDKTINDVGNVSLYPIPYNFITGIKLNTQEPAVQGGKNVENFTVSHPNEAYYTVKGLGGTQTLVLSQSFDKGWKAYQVNSAGGISKFLQTTFPFIFASEIKNHVQINNWENGWEINKSEFKNRNIEIIIVYVPQYLEFLGFFTIAIALFFILRFKN